MNTMKWLVKREFWEHKGGFFWAPIWVGGIMTFFLAISLFAAAALGSKHGFQINGTTVTSLSGVMSAKDKAEFASGLATGYMGMAGPLFMVLGFVVFFFCLGSLFDGVPRAQVAALGETRNVGVADLFVAKMKGTYA